MIRLPVQYNVWTEAWKQCKPSLDSKNLVEKKKKKSKHAKKPKPTTKINPKPNQKKTTETNNPNHNGNKSQKRNHPLGSLSFLALGHFISQVDGKVQRSWWGSWDSRGHSSVCVNLEELYRLIVKDKTERLLWTQWRARQRPFKHWPVKEFLSLVTAHY